MKEENDTKNENAFDEKEIQRAWAYHQNADTMQHQRHILFMMTQTIFFAGFFTASGIREAQWLVLVLGAVFAILWWQVAEHLELRLDEMRRVLEHDRVWRCYINAVPSEGWLGGRYVFNRWLPGLTFTAWACLSLVLVFHAQPSGPGSGSQPIGSGTIQTSSTAGSRR